MKTYIGGKPTFLLAIRHPYGDKFTGKLITFHILSGKSMNKTRVLFFNTKVTCCHHFPQTILDLYTVFHDSGLCCGEETHMHPFMEKYFLLKNEADVQHSCGKFIV